MRQTASWPGSAVLRAASTAEAGGRQSLFGSLRKRTTSIAYDSTTISSIASARFTQLLLAQLFAIFYLLRFRQFISVVCRLSSRICAFQLDILLITVDECLGHRSARIALESFDKDNARPHNVESDGAICWTALRPPRTIPILSRIYTRV